MSANRDRLLRRITGGENTSLSSGATAANQAEVINRLNTLLGENATEAEQNELQALVTALLSENATEARQVEIITKLDLLFNAAGTLQPPLAKTATDTVTEAIAATTSTLKWNITNLSSTDELYYCLGADATLLNSRVLLPFQSVWSDNLIEARARVTAIAKAAIIIPYSIQLTTV